MNGEDPNPDGCYAVLTFVSKSTNKVVVVAKNMLHGTDYLQWETDSDGVSAIETHMQYFVVSFGHANAAAVFSLYASSPLYTLAGSSPISVSLVVQDAVLPPLVSLGQGSMADRVDHVLVAFADSVKGTVLEGLVPSKF